MIPGSDPIISDGTGASGRMGTWLLHVAATIAWRLTSAGRTAMGRGPISPARDSA